MQSRRWIEKEIALTERKFMDNKIDLRNIPIEELKELDFSNVNTDITAPDFEPNRQYYFMAKLKNWFQAECKMYGRTLTYHVETFGCQMNVVTQKWGVPLFS